MRTIRAKNGLKLQPDYDFASCPPPDILLIPGGSGTRKAMHHKRTLSWVKSTADGAQLLLTVCTGSLVLAAIGLLDGLKATTHHEVIPLLRETAPDTEVLAGKRFIDNGSVIVSAGISAGIDMCLYVVARLHGEAVAEQTARYMEYSWKSIMPEGNEGIETNA
jgi:transcriptional regulator GlxA family with amidase domain